MTWTTRYHPPEASLWQGRADSPAGSSFFQIIQMVDLKQPLPELKDAMAFCVVGFCSDEGIRRNLGRPGASAGPNAIREVLSRLPIQKKDFIIFDAGNIDCVDGNLEASQEALAQIIVILLKNKITPIVLGGGHEVAWGHYQGIALAHPDSQLGIVNFDAHFDMRPLLPHRQGSSGTPFLQIAQAHKTAKRRFDYNCIGIQHAGNTHYLFDTAKHWNTQTILADDFHQGYMDKCVNFIDRVIDQNEIIYTTICLDVFASPFAPGVSAPQPLGLTPWQVIPLVRQLAASGKVISYDIAEMCPHLDDDQRTAKLAANLIYEIVHHHHKPISGLHYGIHSAT